MDDDFNFDERPKMVSPRTSWKIWDVLSMLLIGITTCVSLYFLLIFINPSSPLNLLPPSPRGRVDSILTATPVQTPLTSTASPPIEATSTSSPAPTSTPEMPFRASSVTAVRSTLIAHLQDSGCEWFGIGGTVEDINRKPIVGMVIRLAGTLSDHPIELTTLSGVSSDYGRAGFEFMLGNVPLASDNEMYIQLLDQEGLPLSEKVFLSTSADCDRNLLLVRFTKDR